MCHRCRSGLQQWYRQRARKPPGPKAQELIRRDELYTAPAYGRVYPLAVKEGRGMAIEDVDGNFYLDFTAGIAVASTGHSHPKVVAANTARALAQGAGYHYTNLPGAPAATHFPPGYPLMLAPLWWVAPTFPANVANSAKGDSILVATADFNAVSQGGGADFLFSNGNTAASNGGDPLHPMQSPNGRIVWAPGSQNCGLTFPVDSLATGTATADFGTAAGPLSPASDNGATRLSNLNAAPTDNSTEYSLQAVATSSFAVPFANLATDFTTPRNNGRVVLNLATSPIVPSVGGVARPPDASNGSADAATRDGGRDRDLIAYARGRLPLVFKTDPGTSGWSDHEPYELAGIPVGWIESLPDSATHKTADVPSRVQASRERAVGQLLLSYVASRTEEDLADLRR